jgi:hypothetical protein
LVQTVFLPGHEPTIDFEDAIYARHVDRSDFRHSSTAAAQNIPATAGFDTKRDRSTVTQPAFSFASKPTKPRVFPISGAGRNRHRRHRVGSDDLALHVHVRLPGKTRCSAASFNGGLAGRFSMLGGQLLASAWMRHKAPNGKLWMMPAIIATQAGLAAVLNVRTMHQLSGGR